MLGAPVAFAQQPNDSALEEVIVTAQKREENLQTVPISVQAIGTEKLEQLHIQSFDDYVKFLPSVTFQAGGAGGGPSGPGFARVLMRGISSDSNLNHSGPLPTVGTYLDEQPITTIKARSICICTTLRASKRSPARRARCTARAPKPARSGSSRTSRIRISSRPATKCRGTPSPMATRAA